VNAGESIAQTIVPAAPADRRLVRIQWAVAATALGLVVLAIVRLWFIDGLLRRVTIDGPSMAPALCGANFLATCDDCGFPFRCDAQHAPEDGQAACPNCGYSQNPLAAAILQPPDRVLIDRWQLLGRSPQRGEIVALRVPESAAELAVKRIAAVSPGQLAIRAGDLYLGGDLVRKSPTELRAVRLLVHDNAYLPQKTKDLPPRWRGATDDSLWQTAGVGFRLSGADGRDGWDWLQYEHWACTAYPRLRGIPSPIRDNDPYNQGETRRELNAVSDVLLSCRVQTEGTGQLAFAAVDGEQRFELLIEPAARIILRVNGRPLEERPLKLTPLRSGADIEFGLCDQQVLLSVAGRTIFRVPYERAAGPQPESLHPLAVGARDLRVQLTHLRIWRDLYYLDPQGLSRDWQAVAPLSPGHFAVLGDNQPVSSDSRQWPVSAVIGSSILGRVYRPFWTEAR
jgi:hypothetical protein